MNGFDFIICGAGTAGCILANRLSSDPETKVLLVEAGQRPIDPLNPAIGASVDHWDGPLDWAFRSTPQKNLNGRQVLLNRGKALGGSSAINWGMYVRGNRGDYDHWAQLGNLGWSYDEVLPYFRKSEANANLQNEFHGADGPIHIEYTRHVHPIHEMYFEALEDFGVSFNPDYNGSSQEGSCLYQLTTLNGRRWSAADGYLYPVIDRPNLTVVTGAHITALSTEGQRVTGVHYAMGREAVHAVADETIVSLGAIGSPHLLLLSGIGPANELAQFGIDVVHDLRGVGKNLLDHFARPDPVIILKDPERFGFPIPPIDEAWAQFERDTLGPFGSMGVDAGGFVKLRETDAEPSAQLLCMVADRHRHRELSPRVLFGGYICRTQSRGEITLASSSPFDRPLIDPRYLGDPQDLELNVERVQFQNEVANHRIFDNIKDSLIGPGSDRKAIIAATRAESSTTWHQTSTCRMGVDDRAVVDPQLRICGMEGVRVIDASVFPAMTSGNTNAPTMMIAEKGADMILPSDARQADLEKSRA